MYDYIPSQIKLYYKSKNLNEKLLSSLTEIPIKFGVINGGFLCHGNQLSNLIGCPDSVVSGFYCYDNQLTSLEGCQERIIGRFICNGNKLTNLERSPKSVGGNFYCNGNDLTSLSGCPVSVGGDFYCNKNKLTSLECCPIVTGLVNCFRNKIDESELFLYSYSSDQVRQYYNGND